MKNQKEDFADDLKQGRDGDGRQKSELNQYRELADKWNAIQEAYLDKHPELSMDDLYYEGGGFEGLIEKIAEVRGTSVDEVRKEIADW